MRHIGVLSAKPKEAYSVLRQVSGYTGKVSWIVVRNPGSWTVSLWPFQEREQAQAMADDLNRLFGDSTLIMRPTPVALPNQKEQP